MKKGLIVLAVVAALGILPSAVSHADFSTDMKISSMSAKISSLEWEVSRLKNELSWLKADVRKLTERMEGSEGD